MRSRSRSSSRKRRCRRSPVTTIGAQPFSGKKWLPEMLHDMQIIRLPDNELHKRMPKLTSVTELTGHRFSTRDLRCLAERFHVKDIEAKDASGWNLLHHLCTGSCISAFVCDMLHNFVGTLTGFHATKENTGVWGDVNNALAAKTTYQPSGKTPIMLLLEGSSPMKKKVDILRAWLCHGVAQVKRHLEDRDEEVSAFSIGPTCLVCTCHADVSLMLHIGIFFAPVCRCFCSRYCRCCSRGSCRSWCRGCSRCCSRCDRCH